MLIHLAPRARYVCLSCSLRLSKQSRRYASSPNHRRAAPAKYLPGKPVRTRFAPSPTGYLHLGSLRTALFNYLLAKRTGGQFILRIEDTDAKRTVPGAEERILKDLRWAGLLWDEGPEIDGSFGPYRQSERTAFYQSHAEILLQIGSAYRCFCTSDQLRAKADLRVKRGLSSDYDRACYHIPKEQSDERASQGHNFVVRLKDPELQPVFHDLVYGHIKDGKAGLRRKDDSFDDPIILKSDGLPTYHLANVVDDHHMEITHVIRGAEWLISTRKHLILYDAFGWKPPSFAHVGLLLDEAGNKLSKRDKAYDLSAIQDNGVLPEALNNFLALLGWTNRASKRDFATMQELEETFDLKFTKGNPTVALEKLWFLSPRHAAVRLKAGGWRYDEMVDHLVAAVYRFSQSHASQTLPIVDAQPDMLRKYVSRILQSDSKNYTDASDFVMSHSYYFLREPPCAVKLHRHTKAHREVGEHPQRQHWSLDKIRAKFLELLQPAADSWEHDPLAKVVSDVIEFFAEERRCVVDGEDMDGARKWMSTWMWQVLRGYVAWGLNGPSLVDTMVLLGPEIVLARIRDVDVILDAGKEILLLPGNEI